MGIKNWNAGIIRPVPVAPTGPYSNNAAPGVWTLDQQAYWQKQGLWPTAGNVDPSAFIENLFSTYLYTGSNSAQTITNGIDLAGKGGLVWLKGRSVGSAFGYGDHELFDSVNVSTTRSYLRSDGTDALGANGTISSTPFTSSGFNLTAGPQINNRAGDTSVSWTFREQPKFFDIVTYTGNGTSQNISHNLGSVPGCMIVKSTSNSGQRWNVYHRAASATPQNGRLALNTVDAYAEYPAIASFAGLWNLTQPTSTVFTVGNNADTNNSGSTYVAYLFAHNAGGFGLNGTDNVISCGTFTGLATVDLGYEPQWILYKTSSSANSGWLMVDNMRGFTSGGADPYLEANLAAAEQGGNDLLTITSTGFKNNLFSGDTFIYIAIRRGPMKTPTLGTSVFSPVARTGTSATAIVNAGFVVDLGITKYRTSGSAPGSTVFDRLRGKSQILDTTTAGAEPSSAFTGTMITGLDLMTGVQFGTDADGFQSVNRSPNTYANWMFRRAPSFFDEVCYTGNGNIRTVTHNLGAIPELMIVKARANARDWIVYASALGNTKFLVLNYAYAQDTNSANWDNTSPTSTVFTVGGNYTVNDLNAGMVAYLFATCPGVSKVGSYTGTAALQTVACGFTTGARFVLIKRTDSTGDWYVWDSARGITSGNDPYLLLNNTAAEVTGTNYVDTDTTGFQVTAAAPAGINAVGGTYIFLAVA